MGARQLIAARNPDDGEVRIASFDGPFVARERVMTDTSDACHELLDRLPELSVCYERIVLDWNDFEGAPPGDYLVFSDICGVCIDVLASLPPEVTNADGVMRRVLELGEVLVASVDSAQRNLGVLEIAERFDLHPRGRAIVSTLGGPVLSATLDEDGGAIEGDDGLGCFVVMFGGAVGVRSRVWARRSRGWVSGRVERVM